MDTSIIDDHWSAQHDHFNLFTTDNLIADILFEQFFISTAV